MQVVADLATLRIVPWERDTAICLGDCYFDGGPLSADPRGILKRAIAEAEQRGLRARVRPRARVLPLPPDAGAGSSATRRRRARLPDGSARATRAGSSASDGGRRARLGLPFVCVEPGVRPVAVGDQHAATRTRSKAADEAHLLKLAIKEIAAMHGLVATFMGRPMEGGTSGYHLHISAVGRAGAESVRRPATAKYGLSELARWFIGGLLDARAGARPRSWRRRSTPTSASSRRSWRRTGSTGGPTTARSTSASLPSAGRRRGSSAAARDGTASAVPCLGRRRSSPGLDGVERKLDPGPRRTGVYEPRVGETMPLLARRGARRARGGRVRPGQAGRAVRPGLRRRSSATRCAASRSR